MRIGAGFVMMLAAFCAVGMAQPHSSDKPTSTLSAKLHTHRSSPDDLELSGDLPGVPAGKSRFIARGDLLAISQPMTISPDDGNFRDATQVRAVPLEKLADALGVAAGEMMVADCRDKYQAHYPRAYLSVHHPVLVTEMNGAVLLDTKEDDYGPYMIAHEHFSPAFNILAHTDEPQIPWGVVRFDFRSEKTVFGAIAPRGPHSGEVSVQDGFKIARQNCFRCHNNGSEGGLKSGVTWTVLGAMAANSPDFFTDYVRDPKAKNPKTQMAASPNYDDATMRALIAYFRTFSPTETH